MKAKDSASPARIEELRHRLNEIDAERAAVAVELHRMIGSEIVQTMSPARQKDPIAGSEQKDWHIFAGPAKPKPRKAKGG